MRSDYAMMRLIRKCADTAEAAAVLGDLDAYVEALSQIQRAAAAELWEVLRGEGVDA